MPRFGIAMPSYLGAPLIRHTLESVIGQTHEDWRCVVVNDGEDDGTADVVAELGDPRIRYLRNEKRLGQLPNFNRAILEALKDDPDFVRLLCADDLLYPHDLADMARVFEARPGVGLVATHFDGIGPDGRYLFRVDMAGRDDLVMSGRDYLLSGVAVGNTIGGPSSVAIRREALVTAGLFDTRLDFAGDSDLWHRVAAGWDVAWVGRRAGLMYRFHGSSVSGRGKLSAGRFVDQIQVVRRVAAAEPLFGPRWWTYQYTIGRMHSVNLQYLAAMARRGRWDGVAAGVKASLSEGIVFYAPFWLPRLPWALGRALLGLPPTRRTFWRRVHERLQPPTRPVSGEEYAHGGAEPGPTPRGRE